MFLRCSQVERCSLQRSCLDSLGDDTSMSHTCGVVGVGWWEGGLCTDRPVFLACCLRKLVSHLLSGLFSFRNYLNCTSIRFMLIVSIQIQFPPLITVTFNILNLVFPLNFATDKISSNVTRSNITSFSGEWFGYLFRCRRLYLS